MNILLTIGMLLIVGYLVGWLLSKMGLPQIIGYILTGIALSPNTLDFVDSGIGATTQPLMEVCLAFIAFEVGGALQWSRVKKHEKEIINITALASLIPFILIMMGVYMLGLIFPTLLPFDSVTLLLLACLLGALASPTAPAATLAVIHQFKAKGNVSDTILGVAALDDVLGILLFSLTIGVVSISTGSQDAPLSSGILNSLIEIVVAISLGACIAALMDTLASFLKIKNEGQWIVIILSLILLCTGLSKLLKVDEILSNLAMGVVVVNRSRQHIVIFRILNRYTEDLIFLFFFVLSGLHLDVSTIPQATVIILAFVILRAAGKFIGANLGGRIAKADKAVCKYTAGGLLPQAGIVIGLVLSIYKLEEFKEISELLLTIIMGATVINELIGPIVAKYSLLKSGEIRE